MSVIDFLSRRAAATFQVDVEREFHVQRSTASVLIKRMMARGLVTRVVAISDSRKRQLRLTSQGQKLVPIVTAYLEQQDAKMVAGLSAGEAVAFRLALRQVAQWGKVTEREDEENGN